MNKKKEKSYKKQLKETLKQKVLDKAVRGLLVEQNGIDQPASELIKQIEKEKEQLIKEGKLKKQKPLSKITQKEMPFEIPSNWKWVRIGDISNVYNGNSISKSLKDNKYSKIKDGLRYVGTKDVDFVKQQIDYCNDIRIPVDEKGFRIVENNTVLICSEGGSAGKKVGVTSETSFFGNKLYATQAIKLNNLYIYYLYKSTYFFNHFTENTTGIIPGISSNNFKKLVVPLPPLEEQERIVDKIEELFAVIDAIDETTVDLNEKIEILKQKILDKAIKGELVEQDPQAEPASELLKQIQKDKSLLQIGKEDLPFEIPNNWEWVRLGDIVEINKKIKGVDDHKKISFLPMRLISDGLVNEYSPEIKTWKDYKKGYTHIKQGDVLLAKITPCFQNLKSVYLKNLDTYYGAATTEVICLTPNVVIGSYLLWFFKKQKFIDDEVYNFSGTAGQQRIGLSFVKNYMFPLPPLEEQERIVAKIEELFTKLDEIKQIIN